MPIAGLVAAALRAESTQREDRDMQIKTCVAALAVVTLAGVAAGETVRIDFGSSSTATVSPVGGAYWNNFAPGGFENLVDTDNNATGISLFATTGVSSGANGGLFGPSGALLGGLAVESATQDYVFTAGATISLTFDGLDAGKSYDFRLFGTRATDGVRETRYTLVGGGGSSVAVLQTSGAGIGADGVYNGNDDETADFSGITADANGQIILNVDIESGGFAYLGALEFSIVPAPGAMALLGLGGVVIGRRRRGWLLG